MKDTTESTRSISAALAERKVKGDEATELTSVYSDSVASRVFRKESETKRFTCRRWTGQRREQGTMENSGEQWRTMGNSGHHILSMVLHIHFTLIFPSSYFLLCVIFFFLLYYSDFLFHLHLRLVHFGLLNTVH